jgi:hypothetical protein
MKKLFVAAALLMATTAAHAGNSISFEIDGQKIHIVAPKGCDQLSCIQIKAPGLSGSSFGLKNFKSGNDDNDAAQRSARAGACPDARGGPAAAIGAVDPGDGCANRACAGGKGRNHHDHSASILLIDRRDCAGHSCRRARSGADPGRGHLRTRAGANDAGRRMDHRRKQRQRSHRELRTKPVRI